MKAPHTPTRRQGRQNAAADLAVGLLYLQRMGETAAYRGLHVERKDLGLLLQPTHRRRLHDAGAILLSRLQQIFVTPAMDTLGVIKRLYMLRLLACGSHLREQPALQAGDVTRTFAAQRLDPVFHVLPPGGMIRALDQLSQLLQPAQTDGTCGPFILCASSTTPA